MLPRRIVAALKERYEIACRLADLLGTHQAVSSTLVFGSVAHGDVDERSDVNLFIVCRPEVIPIAERMRLFSQVGSGWRFGGHMLRILASPRKRHCPFIRALPPPS